MNGILDYDANIKVIVPKDSPFAFQSSLKHQDLTDYPIVMYTSQFWEDFSHSFAEKYSPLNILFTAPIQKLSRRH